MNNLTVGGSAIVGDLRSKVFELERTQLAMPQVDIKVTHRTGPGFIERTIEIPAGTSLTGAIQKFGNINHVTKGAMNVLTANGVMEDIRAPWCEITPAGTKRVGFAYEDTVWTTVFITDLTDPEQVVEHFTTNNEQEYLAFKNLALEGISS